MSVGELFIKKKKQITKTLERGISIAIVIPTFYVMGIPT